MQLKKKVHCFVANVTRWRDRLLNSNVAYARTYKIFMQHGNLLKAPYSGVLESTQNSNNYTADTSRGYNIGNLEFQIINCKNNDRVMQI